MITRRAALGVAFGGTVAGISATAFGSPPDGDADSADDELDFPPLSALNPRMDFGYAKPSREQIERAKKIIEDTPRGPLPVDVAQSFIDRFYDSDKDVISQWPMPKPWNPLIVAFFDATEMPETTRKTDMIPWCAAFANWCIEWARGDGSRSASSQSFLSPSFRRVTTPVRGDLVVFSNHDPATDQPLGSGHVAFIEPAADGRLVMLGGNQSGKKGEGRYSIISRKPAPTTYEIKDKGTGAVKAVARLTAYVSLT